MDTVKTGTGTIVILVQWACMKSSWPLYVGGGGCDVTHVGTCNGDEVSRNPGEKFGDWRGMGKVD